MTESADKKNAGCSKHDEPDRTANDFGIHSFMEYARIQARAQIE
jgi:hypothetical protein